MNTPTPLTGIEAMTVMYQEEYELRVQKEKELAAALDLQAAYFARCEQLCDALSAAQERAEKAEAERDEIKELLAELHAQVKGECPSLLNEDIGANGEFVMAVESAIRAAHPKE